MTEATRKRNPKRRKKSRPSVMVWRSDTIKLAAKEYEVEAKRVRLVADGSKTPIKALWKVVDSIYCPINKKSYRVYVVRDSLLE